MKNKIIKILESPKIVIPVTLLIVVIAGFFIYKNVGYAPKLQGAEQTSDVIDNQIKNGETIDLAFPKTGRVNGVYVKQGDLVKKGQKLANLDFTDTEGTLAIAKANYQKIINGATSVDIDVAKATVETAKVNLDTIIKQQNLAVESAYRNLLNSTPEAIPEGNVDNYIAPVISGNYILGKEGDIKISTYATGVGSSFVASGIVEKSDVVNISTTQQPIGNSGLYIKFLPNTSTGISNWIISIPSCKLHCKL